MSLTIAERVAKGVQYMDEYGPENWLDLIDLEALDIANTHYCIFGQVFAGTDPEGYSSSGWYNHIGEFEENTNEADTRDYGLDGPYDETEALTDEWERVIMDRRANAM